MFEMFSYDFMRRAFIVGVLVSIIVPLIGTFVVNKKNSMVGDALSHSSLAGVALGLIFGFNPVIAAILVCVVAAFGIEIIRKNFAKSSDLSTAIVMSSGIGLAAILSDFVPGAANFQSFMFGSIVAIPDVELYTVSIVATLVIVMYFTLYKKLVYIIFDEDGARLSGINVDLINKIFTFLIAITVAIASRTVGALMVSSLMVIPVSCAIKISNSFKKTVINSCLFGILFTIIGINLSYYLQLKPGGSIVLTGLFVLILLIVANKFRKNN
ncbi:metal ABC transporter permease [uncultured Finegoldia sp.]|uniref:metal ABC transporter permease n=1 Tax=uncultured Finegoldia sp. TaxID=328009 RepID=UPI00261B0B34|nr:metal ABC transporter permease [uncultured Finegoldia sp.]